MSRVLVTTLLAVVALALVPAIAVAQQQAPAENGCCPQAAKQANGCCGEKVKQAEGCCGGGCCGEKQVNEGGCCGQAKAKAKAEGCCGGCDANAKAKAAQGCCGGCCGDAKAKAESVKVATNRWSVILPLFSGKCCSEGCCPEGCPPGCCEGCGEQAKAKAGCCGSCGDAKAKAEGGCCGGGCCGEKAAAGCCGGEKAASGCCGGEKAAGSCGSSCGGEKAAGSCGSSCGGASASAGCGGGASEMLIQVRGMTCGGCARKVVAAIQGCDGVVGATVNRANGEVIVEASKCTSQQICDAIKAAGFEASELRIGSRFLLVNGMCPEGSNCEKFETLLKKVDGVRAVYFDPADGRIQLVVNENVYTSSAAIATLASEKIEGKVETASVTIKVDFKCCENADCLIADALRAVPGVLCVKTAVDAGTATITVERGAVTMRQLVKAVKTCGSSVATAQ